MVESVRERTARKSCRIAPADRTLAQSDRPHACARRLRLGVGASRRLRRPRIVRYVPVPASTPRDQVRRASVPGLRGRVPTGRAARVPRARRIWQKPRASRLLEVVRTLDGAARRLRRTARRPAPANRCGDLPRTVAAPDRFARGDAVRLLAGGALHGGSARALRRPSPDRLEPARGRFRREAVRARPRSARDRADRSPARDDESSAGQRPAVRWWHSRSTCPFARARSARALGEHRGSRRRGRSRSRASLAAYLLTFAQSACDRAPRERSRSQATARSQRRRPLAGSPFWQGSGRSSPAVKPTTTVSSVTRPLASRRSSHSARSSRRST